MLPSDLDDVRMLGRLLAIEPASASGRYCGIDLLFNDAYWPIIGHVLTVPRETAFAVGDVVVFRPLTYTDVTLDDERTFAVIEERAILATLVGYDAGTPTVVPTGAYVVVEYVMEAQRSTGGVTLADTARNPPVRGVVFAVGPGIGKPLEVAPGDEVLYRKTKALELAIDGRRFEILLEKDVLAVC